MNKKYIIWTVVAVVVILAIAYFYGKSKMTLAPYTGTPSATRMTPQVVVNQDGTYSVPVRNNKGVLVQCNYTRNGLLINCVG